MKPEHRREMLLALVDLYGSALPEGSPERETLADQWDDVNAHISGAKVNEDRLAPMVIATMTWAAGTLRRAVEFYGPDGAATAMFAEQAAELDRIRDRLDHIVNARTRGKQKKGEATRLAVLAAQARGRSISQTAQDLDMSQSRVARIRGQAKKA